MELNYCGQRIMKLLCGKALRGVIFAFAFAQIAQVPARAAAPPSPDSNPVLTNWLTATKSFQRAGDLIGSESYSQATADLNTSTASLPAPYGTMAAQFAFRLDSALKL